MPLYAAPNTGGKTVSVTGVTLNYELITLDIGKTQILTATVAPKNATNKSVTWTSNNPAVATVNASGVVTGIGAGSATILVKTNVGGKTDTCAITVKPSQTTVSVTGVVLNPQTLSLKVGTQQALSATVLPENATNKAVLWNSNNPAVAGVDTNGMVKALSAGTAIITVKTADGNFTGICTVNVESISVIGVSLDIHNFSFKVGAQQILSATVSPDNADNKTVNWSSDNTAVATVEQNGTVKALSVGTAIITVATADGNLTDQCTVTVASIPVTGVSLTPATLNLEVGKTQTMIVTILPADATDKQVFWSSSDELVAIVDANGVVTAKSPGSATIEVKTIDGVHAADCTVTVVAPPPNIYYVALGDSIATGTTSRGTTSSYVEGLYNHLISIYPSHIVTMQNLAHDGDASYDLYMKLKNDPLFQDDIKKANVISISIGGNNVLPAGKNFFTTIDLSIAEAGTKSFEYEYDLIIKEIRILNTTAKIISSTLYNPYNSVSISGYTNDPNLNKQIQPFIDRINAKIKGISDSNYVVADVYSKFLDYSGQGKMGSITYFYPSALFSFMRDPHPNQTGQNLIMEIHKGLIIP